ncbi:WxL domain-containing protein [Oceanobacillus halotolerans]|uniref:WxL domain-containing protein n=1 Tax=Oceanobacillus halotolerans TaxID=2663380 RepID=UPI0013DD2970|nr:WxL domain-containing protein [Oceanobacillus halotolerans]
MVRFKGHEVHEQPNGYIEVVLHLDTSPNALEEFSAELGTKNNGQVEKAAQDYVNKHLPNVKYKKIKVMVGGMVIASMLGMALVAPGGGNLAHAATAETEVGVETGGESVLVDRLSVGTFSAVTLNGEVQNTQAQIDSFEITDPRGSGAGWNVVMTASPFVSTDGEGNELPVDALTVEAPTLTALNESTSTDNIQKTGGTVDNTGTTILSAPVGEGLGRYSVSFNPEDLDLRIPAGAYTGTYTSTITVTINNGP